jgi:hypothetical protein
MPGPEPLLLDLAAGLTERLAGIITAARAALPAGDAVGIPDLAEPGVMPYDLPALAIEQFPAVALALDHTPTIVPTTPDPTTGAPRLEITTQLLVYGYVRTDLGYAATARLRDRYCLAVRTALLSRPRFATGVVDLAGYTERYREVVPVANGRTLGGTIHTVRVRTVEPVDDRVVLVGDPADTESDADGTLLVGLPADVVLDPVDRLYPPGSGHPALA